MSKDLLDLTINQLLDKFGAGSHKPGSGSAAAMLGLIACKMTQTVIKLTINRSEYKSSKYKLQKIKDEIRNEIEPVLKRALNEDSMQFDKVIRARIERDKETDYFKKGYLEDVAFSELQVATEIPIVIAENCIQLTKNGLEVFDNGFQAARGDSAVAVSSALSGATGALSIIYLNLVSFWGDKWAISKIEVADKLNNEINELQSELTNRIKKLKGEVANSNSDFLLDEGSFRPKSGKNSLSYEKIEDSVRKLQNELWKNRRKIWKENPPKRLIDVLKPETAIQLFSYNYSEHLSLGKFEENGELFEVAGLFSKKDRSVSISEQFSPEVKKFTTAHELGHLLLHKHNLTLHRDRPIKGDEFRIDRNRTEIEADKFASYFLMPKREVERVFWNNFHTKELKIDQDIAFAFGFSSEVDLKQSYKSEREFTRMLAQLKVYNSNPITSMVEHFNVSVEAMAIRIEELELVTY